MPQKVVTVPSSSASAPLAEPNPQIDNLQTDNVTIPVKLCNLPPLSSIALQVMSLTADEDMDLHRLAAVIEADPAFAAEVLFLANSSLFGFPSRMHVLRHAVAVLGLDRIKALAVTVAMRSFVGASSPMIRQSWRHSAACAVIAEEISALFEISGDRAYTIALMHDIGRLGLLKSYARDVNPVLAASYSSSADVLAAERAAVNVDHGTAGAWLVKTWAFPQEFVDACARHHDPLQTKDPALLRLVKVSCRMADCLGYVAAEYNPLPAFPQILADLKPDERAKFPPEDDLRQNVEARLVTFER